MSPSNHPRCLVTGSGGFLGRHLIPVLSEHYGGRNIVALRREDGDMADPKCLEEALSVHRPTVLIPLAAYVGGISANAAYPADFWYRNTCLTTHLFELARKYDVKKVLYPMCGCAYPARAPSPLTEESLWDGYPQAESAPYSLAKKMGLVAAEAYHRQYKLNATVVIPGNMYGEHDDFDPEASHVIAATVRKFVEATEAGAADVRMWGSGNPSRDFVYVGDVARLFPRFIDSVDEVGPINISTERRTTIKELALLAAELTGFKGRIQWDASKPDGQMEKVFSAARLRRLGLECPTPLREGLKRTIEWFRAERP